MKIATEIQHFFENDLNNFPLEIEGKILRVVVQVPDLEPLNWLARQSVNIKTYWIDRSGKFTMAGVGALDIIAGNKPVDYQIVFDRLRQDLSPLFPQVRYYGGMGFSQDRAIDPSWQLFGNYRFILPRFEIWKEGIATYFACNFRLGLAGDSSTDNLDRGARELELILQELAELDFTLPKMYGVEDLVKLPLLVDRLDRPDRIDWDRNVTVALSMFTDLHLDKIVLARQSQLRFSTPLQPQSILQALRSHNPLSYHFCFQISPTTAFIGTSPERLYYRHDRTIQTEAIAGTRHRGESIQIDRELSDDLRNSTKDLREHQLVVQNLKGILTQLCESVTIDRQSQILKLNKVQHLYTQCQGILKANLTDADILPELHPTPAVGGFPRAEALQLLHQLEPFERGWYAAPVGWIGYDDAEFAVAIRSGLIDRDRILLFAGAGIVRGSQPEEEWTEIENKICHFTDLFTDAPPEMPTVKTAAIETKLA